jgi:hypothetical protein
MKANESTMNTPHDSTVGFLACQCAACLDRQAHERKLWQERRAVTDEQDRQFKQSDAYKRERAWVNSHQD